uniref:T4S1 protein n=1 Tax=Cyanistes caeruleus TaxID=156563 RepID=A0A8C0VFC8_CYACU
AVSSEEKETAMCVGKCSRIVGPCLLVLATLSMAAGILLLFPGGASKYLLEGHIGSHAKALPGVWGGGIAVSAAGCHCSLGHGRVPPPWGQGSSDCWDGICRSLPLPPPRPLLPIPLALLGAAACFVLSGVGLANGPLCFYNSTELGLRHGNYLHNRSTWSICLEPEGIVTWHVVLFSLLLLISVAEMVLALLQILNGCLGCLCGFCEGK